jgi:alpha-tubulin suppressor-like RCC1 family protein
MVIGDGVQGVTAGDDNTFIVKNDGTILACGDNTYGQLGDGTTVNKLVPTQIILP